MVVDEIGCVVEEVEDVGLFEDEIEQKGKMIINRIVFQLDTIIFFVPPFLCLFFQFFLLFE